MLIIRRKESESILINDEIEIMIFKITPTSVSLGIKAPETTKIDRPEKPKPQPSED